MSLDIYLDDPTSTYKTSYLFEANITHNLNKMAVAAGIYEAIWRPHRLHKDYKERYNDFWERERDFEENTTIIAESIIQTIQIGYKDLLERPKYYRRYDASNGWGTYEDFLQFVDKYLQALEKYPLSIVTASR